MIVANDEWQMVASGNDPKLIVQNVDSARIAWVMSGNQPDNDPEEIALDGDGHGIFNPGMAPLTITGMDTDGVNLYVRALGPRSAKLYVFEP